jgi:hypothetical protein
MPAARPHSSSLLLAFGLFCALGCEGSIEGELPGGAVGATPGAGDANDPGMDPDSGAPLTPEQCAKLSVVAAPSKMRRLQPAEYRRTAAALLADDALSPHLEAQAAEIVSALEVEKLGVAAHELAATAHHESYAPCSLDGAEDATCLRAFISSFGKQAFRRELESDEQAWLEASYRRLMEQAVTPPFTFREGLAALAEIILQAPQHFYVHELGVADASLPSGIRRLTGHERATRLSYFMAGSMPDRELMQAADSGVLDDADGVRAQAERLLQAPAAREMVRTFASGWLGLDATPKHPALEKLAKDPDKFPFDSPELRAAMRVEAERLYERAFFEPGGGFAALVDSREAYVDSALAALYGVAPPPAGQGWVMLPAEQRAGIFTRAAFLTSLAGAEYQSPVLRGVHVYRHVLCQPLPDPPADADNTPPTPSDASVPHTVRELTETKTYAGTCKSCHAIVNPIGYALESYDALGQWQTEESGTLNDQPYTVAVDAHAELAAADLKGAVSGPIELSSLLARSRDAKRCTADAWFERAMSRAPIAEEQCTLERIKAEFEGDGDLRGLVLQLATSDSALFIREAQ